ncbi:VWA domain-containing protein [Acidicapsa dinghuensis]|uniref:VWA domain-containing protein n=1 Tax=Acidicapsa dinghuensis TaxID=2218256 RepID=A0ABW1EGX5_9BACT|nr:VWA domain-containing protein [Acidicapsa dinghuensis]
MSRQVSKAAKWVCAMVCLLACSVAAPVIGRAQQPATPQPSGSTGSTATPQPAQTTQPAQTQPGAQQGGNDDNYRIIQSVNEVNLIFTVTDKHGNFVPNLKQSDFALLDDQKAPARISSFTQQTNLPLRVGILIDASTSIRSRFQFEQQASNEFLLQVLRSRKDRAFVMGFDVTPTIMQDWTDNLDALQTGVTKLRPGGGTALFDAVYTACRDKLLGAERFQEPVRRAIVVISDGNDNQSRAYAEDAIKECQRAETIIYAISTNWTPSRGRGDDVLQKMARATGGRAFFPPSVDEMGVGFQSIEDELRSQYDLTYTPADFKADGSFRTIYLFALDRRYQVRAREGYFAPKN